MKGQAIAGLVLTIVAIVFGFLGGWLSVLCLPMAIVGLVLAVLSGKGYKAAGAKSGLQTAAFVLGIIAVVFCSISFVTCGLCTICVAAGAEAAEDAVNSLL